MKCNPAKEKVLKAKLGELEAEDGDVTIFSVIAQNKQSIFDIQEEIDFSVRFNTRILAILKVYDNLIDKIIESQRRIRELEINNSHLEGQIGIEIQNKNNVFKELRSIIDQNLDEALSSKN